MGGELPNISGADPALVASQSNPQAVSTKGFDPGDIWLTNETPPRRLVVRGTSGMDPDCLVANFEDGSEGYRSKALWIIKHSGYVVGLRPTNEPGPIVYAKPLARIEAGTDETPQAAQPVGREPEKAPKPIGKESDQ